VFCPNRKVFDTMLKFNGVAGLPCYLQRSCYIPKHLEKHSSEPTRLKMQIFYCLTFTGRKQSFFVFHGLHCLQANLLNGCGYFLYRNISSY